MVTCKECIHCDNDAAEIRCRINPPSCDSNTENEGRWPLVKLSDWCSKGEVPAPPKKEKESKKEEK